MSLVNFSNLDFEQIKTSIKDYLRSNSTFSDYDFEGSNLSILIDILAYNTYISSYNANMLSNEVFLDSATLRENVVSLAKHVGYLPRSVTCSKAKISFFIDVIGIADNAISVTLKKGPVCTTTRSFGAQSYVFSIADDITVPVINGIASFDNIEVLEGTLLSSNFIVDSLNKNQNYILDNINIDTTTLRVIVRDSIQSSVSRIFNFVNNISEVKSTDKIFFLSEIADQRYELIFGDGTFGTPLNDKNYIEASYIVTSGPNSNGISEFTFSGSFVDNNGDELQVPTPFVTTIEASGGGKPIEEVSSIKKFAPRVYAAQNRAVTSSDYEALVPLIYPEVESISVFGGEELDPPKFGKVFIAVKPKNGSYIPNNVKDNLKFKLRKYAVAGIVPEFVDLKYVYIEYDSQVYFNTNLTRSVSSVKKRVLDNLIKYAKSTELNRYSSRFKYSKFLKLIDDSDDSITSNITKISMRRDLRVEISKFAEYEVCFGNEFYVKNQKGYNIKSSGFNVPGVSDTVYFSDVPNSDLLTGKLFLFKLGSSSEPVLVRTDVGTVDYVKGEIKISTINIINSKVVDGINIIEFSTIPKSNDIIGKQDLYLQLDNSKSNLDLIEDSISSGRDVSGSQYIVSSSYLNGNLIRR
jgi:hypothetical protein